MTVHDRRPFDLVLSCPQWQGSTRAANLPRGARAAAEVCARHGRAFAQVPDAGAGEAVGGINRWTAILEQIRSAIVESKNTTSLKSAWALTSGKKGKLGEDNFTKLEALKDARKSELAQVA